MARSGPSEGEGAEAPWILRLDAVDRGRTSVAGAKAANLGELVRAGFPAPQGFVLTTQAFERFREAAGLADDAAPETVVRAPIPQDVGRALRSAVEALGDLPLAVRSSGVEEDLPGASFAGQYKTVLDVRGAEAAAEAVRRCWASAFAPRVLEYRRSRGLQGAPRMAVLVQRLVQAEAAGVAFTANPVTGDRREAVVSAVRGLGERLVSGVADADEWTVREDGVERRRAAEAAITDAQALEVATLARKVESVFGTPQDIEWAYGDGRLFLLQARPITALPPAVEWKGPPGVWQRNFRLGEWLGDPVTPLFETWLLDRLESRLYARLEEKLGVPMETPYRAIVHGWYFASLNFLPRGPAHAAFLGLRYIVPGFILRPRAMAIITTRFAAWGLPKFEREWREETRPAYRAAVQEAAAQVDRATPAELADLVDRLADAAGDSAALLLAVAGSAWKPEYVLARAYRKALGVKIGGSHQALLQGLGPAAPVERTGVLSLDWAQPTLGESGSPTLDPSAAARTARAAETRRGAEARALAALGASPRRLRRFERILAAAQRYAAVREEQTAEFTLAWPVMRRAILRIGAALSRSNTIGRADDVFYLTHDELLPCVRGRYPPEPLAKRVRERRSVWERQRRLAPPLRLGEMPRMAGRLLGRYERTLAGSDAAEGLVRGFAASPGRATGPVRVIRNAEEFGRLRAGDVLVAPVTNPSWTPLFAQAAAVVTDTGSLMAHASLVAREYGLPAVVGTGDGTRRLRDGQLVTVDGTRGVVEAAGD